MSAPTAGSVEPETEDVPVGGATGEEDAVAWESKQASALDGAEQQQQQESPLPPPPPPQQQQAMPDISDGEAQDVPGDGATSGAGPSDAPTLFEKPGMSAFRSPALRTSAVGPYEGSMQGGDAGSTSLFDRYASESSSRRALNGNGSTLTSRLRSTGIKLTCYLNTECNRGRSTIIHLPEACDTLGEVFPLIQRRMGLDGRMLYAAELFLPDGAKIASYKQLHEMAQLDTAIIVGCGEPFDSSTVPQSMLSFHTHGGGRKAANVVKKELAEKKLKSSQLKADQVRASGHGLSNAAASAAKLASIETNREAAASMRHDYMNQLIARSAQQTELIRHVQGNNARLRADRARRDAAKKSVWSQERLQDLAENRRKDANTWREKQEQEESLAAKRLDHAKQVRLRNQTDGKLAKSQLHDQRKAAGLERRMSYISRSVEKAAQEQDLVKAHQAAKQQRAAQSAMRMGLSAAFTSQVGSVHAGGDVPRALLP